MWGTILLLALPAVTDPVRLAWLDLAWLDLAQPEF